MKFFPMVFFGFILLSLQMSAQSIEWSNASWKESLEQARIENKMIFVDIYTTWCSPCIKMDKEVFSDSLVGTYFNQDFISIKLNAEDDGEGSLVAQEQNVKLYPTLLFLDSNGSVLTSTVGMQNKYELIDLANKSIALNEQHELLTKVKNNIDATYSFDELKNILEITRIHSFKGKEKLVMSYLDRITTITEEDLRNVMGEVQRMDLSYLGRIAPLTTSLPYKELYLRRNSQEWIDWKNNTEQSVYDHLLYYKKENQLNKYEETLEILKGFKGIKSRQIDNLYLDFYRQNSLEQYRTFAIYLIEEYIIPSQPEDVKIADEERFQMLRDEIMKDMSRALGSTNAEKLFVNEVTNTPTIDSLSEVYTISKSIAEQLYEISGDFFAFFDDKVSQQKASYWASLTYLYYPYDWKYFDNHIFILESIGKPEEAQQVMLEAQSLPWYDELRLRKSSF